MGKNISFLLDKVNRAIINITSHIATYNGGILEKKK